MQDPSAILSEPLLKPEQVAKHLEVEQSTLAAWRSDKSQALPYVRVGRLVRYRPADVAAFIETNLRVA
jgi:predicted DNA-binding transcriptional regulator AlpA